MGTGGDGRDPLLYARFLECRKCGQVAFAVDAGWVEDHLVLATYPASCTHSRGATIIIDVRQLVVELAGVDPEMYLPGRRCTGTNRRRKRCRAYAAPGSDFCRDHDQAGARHDAQRPGSA